MQRILCVISSMAGNGAERVMSLLVNYGVQKNMEVALVLFTDNSVVHQIDNRVKIYNLSENLPSNRVKAIGARFLRLRQHIKDFKPDVVISFLTMCNIYVCAAGLGLGIPVIISERNDPVRDCPNKIVRIIRSLLYRFAQGYIFQTDDAKAYYAKQIQQQAVVIPNPVKNDLPIADPQNRTKVIAAAGRLTKQKNYRMMLDAFALFLNKHPEYRLRIYGDGEERSSLQEYAQNIGVARSVDFMGYSSNLHAEIVSAGMFVMSSDYEGISNSLLESISMGIPSISTDCPCGGARYLIRHGENGLLVPVGDYEALAGAMDTIACSEELATHFSESGHETREAHAEAVILERYYNYFESVLNKA